MYYVYSYFFSSVFSSFFLWNKILSTGKYRKNWIAPQHAPEMPIAELSKPLELKNCRRQGDEQPQARGLACCQQHLFGIKNAQKAVRTH